MWPAASAASPTIAAVAGVANPLDGVAVCVTGAFRRQHRADSIVQALLCGARPSLLVRSLPCAGAAEAVRRGGIAFVSDDEAEAAAAGGDGDGDVVSHMGVALSWRAFLDRVVPGHEASRLH